MMKSKKAANKNNPAWQKHKSVRDLDSKTQERATERKAKTNCQMKNSVSLTFLTFSTMSRDCES
jgi:hypothetical protein